LHGAEENKDTPTQGKYEPIVFAAKHERIMLQEKLDE